MQWTTRTRWNANSHQKKNRVHIVHVCRSVHASNARHVFWTQAAALVHGQNLARITAV
jgi:hypothetical protein